jgi:hypothetical protein
MNVINFLFSLLNVPLWVIVFLTKVMFAMILVLTNVVYPVMLFYLRINVSFLHMLSDCLRLVLYFVLMNCFLCLNDSNLEWCILDIDQLCPFLRLTLHLKLFRPLLLRLIHHLRQFLNLVLDDLPRYHVLLIGMVFPTLLMLLCLLFPFLHAFLGLLNMNVGRKQWMRNFGLSRTIIHETWFLAPLMLKPSVVNGFTRLSSALMGLWIGIRQD